MSGLVLPTWVAANAERDKFAQQSAEWQHMDRQLKELDPQLSLVYVPERVPVTAAPGILPGRWHVKRASEGELDLYIPICGAQGEYRDPDSGIVEELRRRDLWKREVWDEMRTKNKRDEAAREREQATKDEERAEDFALAVKAHANPGVAFGVKGWTPKAGARKEKLV